MSIIGLIILCGVLSVLGLMSFITLQVTDNFKNFKTLRKYIIDGTKGCAAGIAIAGLAATLILSIGYRTALAHGMYDNNISVIHMFQSTQHSPVEDTLPDDISGSLVIYYRFTCSDCEAVYEDINRLFRSYSNVYWVSTRSEQGQELMEQYPVNNVPSAVYFDKNGQPHTYPLSQTESDETVLDEESVDRLLYFLNNKL